MASMTNTMTTRPVREHELYREVYPNRGEIWRIVEVDDLDNGGAIERRLECISQRSLDRGLAWAYCATIEPAVPISKTRGMITIVRAYLVGMTHIFTDVASPSLPLPLPVEA